VELVEKIARHVEEPLEVFEAEARRPTLRTFSLVCRSWYDISRRVARNVNIVLGTFDSDSAEKLVQAMNKFEFVDDLRLCCEQRGFKGRLAPALAENFPQLRVLRIVFHSHLRHATQWKFAGCLGSLRSLRALHLRNVPNLAKLPSAAGQWGLLSVLSLTGCVNLRELPQEAGKWHRLKHLDLSECEELHHLPTGCGNWTKLEMLDLTGCRRLEDLPAEARAWTLLRKCSISGCFQMQRIPDELTSWRALSTFNAADCCHLTDLDVGLQG
jgi:hypothetical protein